MPSLSAKNSNIMALLLLKIVWTINKKQRIFMKFWLEIIQGLLLLSSTILLGMEYIFAIEFVNKIDEFITTILKSIRIINKKLTNIIWMLLLLTFGLSYLNILVLIFIIFIILFIVVNLLLIALLQLFSNLNKLMYCISKRLELYKKNEQRKQLLGYVGYCLAVIYCIMDIVLLFVDNSEYQLHSP